MNNATTKKIFTFVLTVIIAVGILQPMTVSFADFSANDIYIPSEASVPAAETFEAVCENFPLTDEKVPEETAEDIFEEASDADSEGIFEEIPDDASVCETLDEFPEFKEENAENLIENEVPDAKAENEIEAEAETAEEIFSLEFGASASIRPDTKYPDDPDGRPGDKHLIDSKTEEKILETASHAIPFGSTIYHVVRHLSGKDDNPSKAAEDIASEAISLALDTLCPGSSSIFSVVKDLAKKLLPQSPTPTSSRS